MSHLYRTLGRTGYPYDKTDTDLERSSSGKGTDMTPYHSGLDNPGTHSTLCEETVTTRIQSTRISHR